jgi:hypothetical protein
VLEASGDQANTLGGSFEVISEAGDLVKVRTAPQDAGIDYESAEPGASGGAWSIRSGACCAHTGSSYSTRILAL